MLRILYYVEKNLELLVQQQVLNTMYINYHKPFVSRIWFQLGRYRVCLHRIEPCNESAEALYHPHPWKSAVRIIQGSYRMGVGYSETNKAPLLTDPTMVCFPGTAYQMVEKDSWHYVSPMGGPVYSLMVTGEKLDREMPIEAPKDYRKLTEVEQLDIVTVFQEYYKWKSLPDLK